MKLRIATNWLTTYVGIPLLAFLLMVNYSEVAAEIAVFILGFYALVLLFLSTAPRSGFGVSSLGYEFAKSMLRIVSPFIWALIVLTFLYALMHTISYRPSICGYIC
jgi:hypothetical protein